MVRETANWCSMKLLVTGALMPAHEATSSEKGSVKSGGNYVARCFRSGSPRGPPTRTLGQARSEDDRWYRRKMAAPGYELLSGQSSSQQIQTWSDFRKRGERPPSSDQRIDV